MRARGLACAALTAILITPVRAQGPASAAAEVKVREQTLVAAMLARDAARIDQLLAPDFVLRSAPDVDRATWLRNALALCWGDRSDIDDFHARTHDDTVVATFALTLYMNPETCRPAVLRSLITDVWVPASGGWRLALRHSGPVPQAGAGVIGQYGIVPEPPPVWEIGAELSLVATSGSTSTRTLGFGSDTQHRSERTTTRLTLSFLTSEADDVTQAEALSAQARHGVRLGPHLQLFGRGGYARDRFAGINNRTTTDAGLSSTAALTSRQSLTGEAGAGFIVEQRLDGTTLRFETANGAVSYVWKVKSVSELHEDATVTADLEEGRNWRTTSATSLLVQLTRVLSLKVSHALEYRHRPVAGFRPTDIRTSAALVMTLQHRPRPQ